MSSSRSESTANMPLAEKSFQTSAKIIELRQIWTIDSFSSCLDERLLPAFMEEFCVNLSTRRSLRLYLLDFMGPVWIES